MQSHGSPQERYLSALKERNISYKRDDIESAFNAASKAGRENAQWVADHLGTETLLSREELNLLGRLEASGALQNFLPQSDLPTTRPLLEEDILTATTALKSSTAAILKQTSILKAQHELARRQSSRDNDSERDQHQELGGLNRKHRLEKQRVTAAADDLKNDIDTRLSAQREQALAEKRQLLASVTAKLKDDDRALAKAETLASGLESTEEDHVLKNRAAELISALSRFVSEEIYCRLDRLYLETLEAGHCVSGEALETNDSIIVLEEDLESLYSEVEVLAEMSARQQFGEQILRELQRNHDRLNSTLQGNLDLVLHSITEMTVSVLHITEQLLYSQSCRESSEALSIAYLNELRCKPAGQPSAKKVLRRDSSLGTGGAPHPTGSDRVESTFIPQSQALENFLRRLGIPGALENSSSERLSLQRCISEKRSRMVELLQNLSAAADMSLAEYLTRIDRATVLLYSALQADSECLLSLVDVPQKQRLIDLERELGLVQKGMERIDLEVLGQRDKAHERFMERWG